MSHVSLLDIYVHLLTSTGLSTTLFIHTCLVLTRALVLINFNLRTREMRSENFANWHAFLKTLKKLSGPESVSKLKQPPRQRQGNALRFYGHTHTQKKKQTNN